MFGLADLFIKTQVHENCMVWQIFGEIYEKCMA